jgi:hypothetical protein
MTVRLQLTTLALVVALLAGATAPLSADADDISGTWKASFDTPIGQQNYTYVFKVQGTALTGTAKSEIAETELKDGKVDGETVTFVENLNFQGMDLRIEYTGKIVSADEIRFTRKVGDFATEELVAKRAK